MSLGFRVVGLGLGLGFRVEGEEGRGMNELGWCMRAESMSLTTHFSFMNELDVCGLNA